MLRNQTGRVCLIVGRGSAARRHVEIVRKVTPSICLAFIRGSCPQDLIQPADILVDDVCELTGFELKFAIIATQAPLHLQYLEILSKFKFHILVEKPLCESTIEAGRLRALLNHTSSTIQVGFNLRYSDIISTTKKLLVERSLGNLISAHIEVGQNLRGWRKGVDYRNSVSAKNELGGGVLLELSHELDYAQYLFGEVFWAAGWAGKYSDLDIDTEDTAKLLLVFGEALNHLGFSTKSTEFLCSLSLDFVRTDSTRTCTIIGEDATLLVNLLDGTISKYRVSEKDWTQLYESPHTLSDTFSAQWTDFLLRSNNLPYSNDARSLGITTIEIIDAIKNRSVYSRATKNF